jgi:hypothetical protein
MSRLKLFFGRSDADVDTVAQNIITHMTNNPHFPNPYPKLEDVIKVAQTYSSSVVDAQTGDRIKVTLKKSAKKDLIEILKALGNYVMSVAQSDEAMLATSGFTLVKKRQASSPLNNPQKFLVKPGKNKGEIVTSVERIAGARSYVHEYTLEPLTEASIWTSVTTTSRKHLFTDLESGKSYLFRVAAVGINGQIVYTAPQPHIAL